MRSEKTCDSCGNVVLVNEIRFSLRAYAIELVLPNENADEFISYEYFLCTECRRKILDFIEEKPETEVRVDPLDLETTIDMLRQEAMSMEEQAERLQDHYEADWKDE